MKNSYWHFIMLTSLLCLALSYTSFKPAGKTSQSAHIYYVDADNGSDSNDGTSTATAWKTLAKVNSNTYGPGDQILLKRGDVFQGPLNISSSGSKSNNIKFDNYGTGQRPIINGFVVLSGWKSVGRGVWEADCPGCTTNLDMVVMDNTAQGMGRYPNASAPNGGFITFQSHSNSNTIFSNDLDNGTDWTGADIVVRRTKWVLERGMITAQSNNSITYKNSYKYPFVDNFGFFIENDPRTLDEKGEWYFNPSTKRLRIYYGQSSPSQSVIQAAYVDNLVIVNNASNVTIRNISFVGSNIASLKLIKANNITVSNNTFNFSGRDAINFDGANDVIDGNNIDHSNSIGIKSNNSPNAQIINNKVLNTGLIPGIGIRYDGIEVSGNNLYIAQNTVDKCGYHGIKIDGNDCTAKNNYVNHFSLVLDDAGGIYTSWPKWRGRQIIGNIILNGVGNLNGTNSTMSNTEGIYLDDSTSYTSLIGNTIANIMHSGIKVHNAHMINIIGNTLFNNQVQIIMDHDRNPAGGSIRDINIKQNIMVSTNSKQNDMILLTTGNDIGQYGSLDSNYYIMPPGREASSIITQSGSSRNIKNTYDLNNWRSSFSFDRNSKKVNVAKQSGILGSLFSGLIGDDGNDNDQIRFEYNARLQAKTISLGNATYYDINHKNYSGSLTLAPYTSIILYKK